MKGCLSFRRSRSWRPAINSGSDVSFMGGYQTCPGQDTDKADLSELVFLSVTAVGVREARYGCCRGRSMVKEGMEDWKPGSGAKLEQRHCRRHRESAPSTTATRHHGEPRHQPPLPGCSHVDWIGRFITMACSLCMVSMYRP